MISNSNYHTPVLLQEVIDNLNPGPGETFIDGTLGSGGHARAIGEKLGAAGQLFGLDQDSVFN